MNARKLKPLEGPAAFFYEHAGWSYAPGKESSEAGRRRGARSLARAEAWATKRGIAFHWSVDPNSDSSDWSDEKPAWPAWQQWQCALVHRGECVASLHGVDFGREGSPYSDPYARVVQAELADEAKSENRI